MDGCVLLPLAGHDGPRTDPRPGSDPSATLVENERVIQTLQRQAAAQNYLLEQTQQQKESIAAELTRRDATEQALRAEFAAQTQREQALRAELVSLTSSDSWRTTVVPPGSLRERLFFLTKRALKLWRRQGVSALVVKATGKIGAKALHAWRSALRASGPDLRARTMSTPSTLLRGLTPPAQELVAVISASVDSALSTRDVDAQGDRVTAVRTLPALDEILALAPRLAGAKAPAIDVILRAEQIDETIGCLRSLLVAPAAATYEVVVHGGAGLDPLLRRYLHEIAAAGLITLLVEPQEPGERLRRALALHAGRDVVLLEAGTAVYGDWVARLRATACAIPDGGTVSPLTNAATPCGYPFIDAGGTYAAVYPLPDDLAPDVLDRLCATVNRGRSVELLAGTGPCLYIRRDCLIAVSPAEQLPVSGDRLDTWEFSRRAREAGWRHLAAVDTFVYQNEQDRGGTTRFGSADNPMAVAHRMANPALPFRRQIDLARLAGPESGMLYVTHDRGGGTERHVADMAARLTQEGVRVIVLRPNGEGSVRLERLGETTLPNLVFTLPGEYWTLRAAIQNLGIRHVHIHHTIDLPATVLELIGELGLTYDWTIHDYYPVCPRVNLLDDAGVYCGEPGPIRCNVCLEKKPQIGGEKVEIREWREDHRTWLAGARKVFVPHEDVAVRLARYFPDVIFTVRPHFETRSASRLVAATLSSGEPLRVAVIGHLCLHKGAAILVDCARDALARMLPIQFVVIGHTDRDALLREMPNVSITGPYREDEILELLESLRCHCAFFPSVWPETFSYTLSIAFRAGLFPIAFDLGAPAGRIRAAGTGHLIPLTTDVTAINQELLSLAPQLAQARAGAAAESGQYRNLLADYYGLAELESAAA